MERSWFKITENYVLELNTKLKENINDRINTELITNKWNKKQLLTKNRTN